jgi:hypothetical protein
MKVRCLVLLFVFSSFALFAQTSNILIYIAPCTGDNEADSRFFDENFAWEFAGAGYTLVQNEAEANYRIDLQAEENTEYGEYEDAKPRILTIALADIKNNRDIISFGWEYESPEEMAEWDMEILYQSIPAPVIVPPPAPPPPSPDQWRNKWLYALVYGGADFAWFLSENIDGAEYTYTGPTLDDGRRKYVNTGNNQGSVRPLFGAGAEVQFLNFMSVETGAKLRFNSVEANENVPILSFPLYLKFPVKPGKLFMLEPYAGVELNLSMRPEEVKPALISAVGGFQFGIWGGKPGLAFIDASISADLGLSDIKGPYGEGKFQRIALGLSVGYKFGFFNRNGNTAAAPPPENTGQYTDYYDDGYEDYTGEYTGYDDGYEDSGGESGEEAPEE